MAGDTRFRGNFARALMEFVGTATILFMTQVSFQLARTHAALAVLVVVVSLTYAGAAVSGAHYNPAITVAVFMRGRLDGHLAVLYWIAQLCGAAAGSVCGAFLVGKPLDVLNRSAADVGMSVSWTGGLVIEFVFTTLLCVVFLMSTTCRETDGNSFFGLSIGFVFAANMLLYGPMRGALMNPAVGFGLALAHDFFRHPTVFLLLSATNFVAAVLAALLFYLIAPTEFVVPSQETQPIIQDV